MATPYTEDDVDDRRARSKRSRSREEDDGYHHRDRDRDRERRRRSGDRDRSRSRRHRDEDLYYDERERRTGDAPPARGYYERGTSDSRSKRDEDDDQGKAEPKSTKPQSEIDDLTKDQRTVFVSQLVMKATERQLRSFFEKIGKVKDVIMIRDKYTNRHKGFAYVEMANLESVPMVLMLNGTLPDFQKFPILVKASEAEKNFLAKQEATVAQQEAQESQRAAAAMNNLVPQQAKRRKLVIANLHPKISEDDLRTVLAPFGPVDEVQVVSGGRAFVTFVEADDAFKASTRIAGIELGADKPITVAFAEDDAASVLGAGVATSDWRLDADEAGGMAMNAQSRAALMAQLGQRAGMGMAGAAAYAPHSTTANGSSDARRQPTTVAPLTGPPMAAFVMANLFDPATESDPNWREDIAEDVSAECAKFGRVTHLHVDAVSPRGLVHVLMDDARAAEGAATQLHGRWFAGRMITVSYVDPKTHRMQFASEI